MAILRVLHISLLLLALSTVLATPLKRSKLKSARQIELTTQSAVVDQRTGYPEAGFRPKIPFNLPNESTEDRPETAEFVTTTPASNLFEASDDSLTTTVKMDDIDHIPADTYGAPLPADNTVEIEANVVPAPAEDFQPPSEEDREDFFSTIGFPDTDATDAIADIPTFKQTSEIDNLDETKIQLPDKLYGAAKVDFIEPKTDVETISPGINEGVEQQTETDTENEASEESEIDLNIDSETYQPADSYGPPNREFENEENEAEFSDITQQLRVLTQPSKRNSARFFFLPVNKNIYIGRLVTKL